MRSKKQFNNSSLITTFLTIPIRGLVFLCCVLLCPNSDLLADTSPSSMTEPLHAYSSKTKIYFYNPEINTARNLVLKNTWDNYLQEKGEYEFQPVDDEIEFIHLVKTQFDAAFIMAEWLYSTLLIHEQGLEVMFQGIRNGNETYRKILVANKSTLDFENITIASSGSNDRVKGVLRSIYPEFSSEQISNLNILLVPKDIDALMAVGYGLAEMALTTEVGLLKMSRLNKNLYRDMIVLRESSPLKRSILVFKSNNSTLKKNLVDLVSNMADAPNGKQAMSLLGLDEWKPNPTVSIQANHFMDNTSKKGGQNNDN